jgi:hypothetical protein
MSRRFLLLSLLALGACSEEVDPTLGTAQAFSLYGYLDPTADRQALRVAPIYGTIDADTARALGARVTSVEQGTGRVAAWRDSVVTYGDGSVGHVFVADYTPTPGETVEVRVEETGGAGRVTTVDVGVPALSQVRVGEVQGTAGGVTYPLRVEAPRVLDVELLFRVTGYGLTPEDTVDVLFRQVEPFAEAAGTGWALDLNFVSVARAFLASPEVGGRPLRLIEMGARAFVTSPAWDVPPGGLDLDTIIEPGSFTNVAGGFGFVGSGFWTEVRWTPSLTTQARGGFVVDVDPATLLVLNEVSAGGWVELFNPTREAVPVGGYAVRAAGETATFPLGTTVPARGFAVLHVARRIESHGTVEFLSQGGAVLSELFLSELPDDPALGSFGSYPDGFSRPISFQGGRADLFRGRVKESPGAPNRPAALLAVVNEVYTEGPDGWVEVIGLLGTPQALVTHDGTLPLDDWVRVSLGGGFGVAEESTASLPLDQGGGELYVVVFPTQAPPRVFDVRTYGPQMPGRSAGLLPDRAPDAWTDGLLPTRGAPNAAARLGL